MAECCINPVAPALANALENATGVRFRELPLTPERIYSRVGENRLGSGDLSREDDGDGHREAHREVTGDAATVIIGQKVRAGSEQAFEAWQQDMNSPRPDYPGFLGAEIIPPTAVQPDWVVVYRFDSVAHVQAWINSATRQERLDQGPAVLRRPRHPAGDQRRRAGRRSARDGGGHPPCRPGARRRLPRLAGATAPGGEQVRRVPRHRAVPARSRASRTSGPRCTATTTPPTSTGGSSRTERQELLAEGEKFADFQLRTIDNSFGSWFAFDEHGNEAPPPSETKTSIAVWVGLYPTVVMLTLALSPLKMPLWLGLLIGNLMSSFVMSFVTMPYYVNPLLKRWLRPPPDVPAAQDEPARASPSSPA